VGAELAFVDDAQRAAARAAGEPTRDDGPAFRGAVVTYDPPCVFAFTWGAELLRFELLPDGAGTKLVFTHHLSHPSVAARNGTGWHRCLGALGRLLGAPADGDRRSWEDVHEDYLRRMGPALGVPAGGGAMTWERATHVAPERVGAATGKFDFEAWGAAERAGDPVHWEIEAVEVGTRYRLTHHAVGDDAELAATWHALLVQLDMYLAAGQLVPVPHQQWVPAYDALL
jgi:hypothetical protein